MIDCNCENSKKEPFFQSKKILAIITVFAIVMMSFPYYSKIFYPTITQKVVIVESQNIMNKEFRVKGMTCSGCEEYAKQAINSLSGIVSVTASYETQKVNVRFDRTKTNESEIIDKLNSIGYKVQE